MQKFSPGNRSTVSLCMIVKNEAPVIERCIASVIHLLDSWLIIDTGSTDGTQHIVRSTLSELPGELLERPWVDFSHNRNEAIDAARDQADYLLFIDADEELITPNDFKWPELTRDAYLFLVDFCDNIYLRRSLVSTRKPWRYTGVLHEYTICDEPVQEEVWKHLTVTPHTDGARHRNSETYKHDAELLERALLTEPDNSRYVFYLGQSYRDAHEPEKALRAYSKRASMEGYPDETWWAMYNMAQLKEQLEHPWHEVQQAYLDCYENSPDRAGPLFRLGVALGTRGKPHQAWLFLNAAMLIKQPQPHRLFVETAVYNHLLPMEYASVCYRLGHYGKAIKTNNDLLSRSLPDELINPVRNSRRYCTDALKQPLTAPPSPVVHVLVICHSSADLCCLDDIVHSVLLQEIVSVQLHIFLSEQHHYNHELSGESIHLHHKNEDSDWSVFRCMQILNNETDLDDALVCCIDEGVTLNREDALQLLWHQFAESNVLLAYGQTEHANGSIGSAFPAHDTETFTDTGSALADGGPLIMRGSFVAEVIASFARAPAHNTADSSISCSGHICEQQIYRDKLLAKATFLQSRFTEEVISRKLTPAVAPAQDTACPTDSNEQSDQPLISCLMVTGDRLSLAKRAIRSFIAQTYNNKQLVIVCDGPQHVRAALKRYCDTLSQDHCNANQSNANQSNANQGNPEQFKPVLLEPADYNLGQLRNQSVQHADGEIICQWDDDDLSHPQRLQRQSDALIKSDAAACLLNDHLHYLADAATILWVDWTLAGQPGPDQVHPGTIMLWKKYAPRYPESGDNSRQGEDSDFLMQLHAKHKIAQLKDMGYLFLYTYHGANTFDRDHHYRISSFARTSDIVQQNQAQIRAAVSGFPVSKPVQVAGRESPLFTIAG